MREKGRNRDEYIQELEAAILGFQADVAKLTREKGFADEELRILRDRAGLVVQDDQEYRIEDSLGSELVAYQVRTALEGMLHIPRVLFPKRGWLSILAVIKATHPVYRRSGVRKWVEANRVKGGLDSNDARTGAILLAFDVMDTAQRPVPHGVLRGLCPERFGGTEADDGNEGVDVEFGCGTADEGGDGVSYYEPPDGDSD